MGRIFLNTGMSEVAKLRESVKDNLKGIKEEFEDHLQSINDNTSEIQATYEYAFRLEERLKKLQRRMDRIESRMSGSEEFAAMEDETSAIDLNDYEKKIFSHTIHGFREKSPSATARLRSILAKKNS